MQDLDDRSIITAADEPGLDPRRWITLGIMLIAVLIAGLDSTVLNVAIPTILRDFHTTLPSLQWVITGYSLTFAALLIIGGRLGDIFGARRMFIIGAALFALGSLIASLSTGVPSLVIGEAIIEGAGASLMLPATMSICRARSSAANAPPRSRRGVPLWARQSRSGRCSAVSSRRTTRGAGPSA